jgi:hypothetical protein
VRIIEYTVTVRAADGTTRIEPFRLVTTLLDHQQAPAAGLAALYQERWESENGYAELKTRLRGAAFILRSRSPELTCQELFAFLTVYQALCALQTEAARQAGIDPDRISFTVTVRVARDHAASHAIITPRSLQLARRQAISDLLSDTLPRRRDRHYERVRKQPKNNFPAMKRGQQRPPSRVTYKIQVSRKAPSPAQTPQLTGIAGQRHFLHKNKQPGRRPSRRNLEASLHGPACHPLYAEHLVCRLDVAEDGSNRDDLVDAEARSCRQAGQLSAQGGVADCMICDVAGVGTSRRQVWIVDDERVPVRLGEDSPAAVTQDPPCPGERSFRFRDMLQHPVGVDLVRTGCADAGGPDIGLPDLDLRQVCCVIPGLADRHRVVVHSEHLPASASRRSEDRQVRSGPASQVHHHVTRAYCQLGGGQALV